MLLRDVSSSNATLTLFIPPILSIPRILSQFADENGVEIDLREIIETRMGVDGHMVSGIIYVPITMKINYLPTSPDIEVFDAWSAANYVSRRSYTATLIYESPALKRNVTFNNGVLSKTKVFPDYNKTLGNQSYEILWESCNIVPM